MLTYVMDAEKLHQFSDTEPLDKEIAEVTDSLLSTFISFSAIKQYLCPEERIIVDYLPCKLLESNTCFMKGPEDFTTRLSDIQVVDDHCTGLLSFGTVYPCKENTIFHCTLEIYGTDESSVRSHVKKHLSVVKQKAVKAGIHKAMVRFLASVERGMSGEVFDKAFTEFNATKVTWKDFNLPKEMYVESFLWEKNL